MQWLIDLFTGGLFSTISGWISSWISARSNEQIAATNAAASAVNQASQTQGVVMSAAYSHWWSTALIGALVFPLIVYNAKIYIWDACLGWGETPEIHGLAAQWGTAIIYSATGYCTTLASAAAIVSGFGRR